MRSIGDSRGLTLLEVVLALAVFAALILSMYGMMTFITREWIFSSGQIDAQQQLRVLLDRMSRDIRRSTDARLIPAPNASCPDAVSGEGERCLLLDSSTFVSSDIGTRLDLPQEVCLDDVEGLAAPLSLTLLSPYKDETATISCVDTGCVGSPPAGPTATCTGGAKKVRFATQLKYPRQKGELATPLPIRYERDASAQVLRNGIPIAENISSLTFTRPETTLQSASALSAITISVVTASGFVVDDVISVGTYNPGSTCAAPYETVKEEKEVRTIATTPTTTITLNVLLGACHAAGAPVRAQVILIDAVASRTAEGTEGVLVQTAKLSMRVRLRN